MFTLFLFKVTALIIVRTFAGIPTRTKVIPVDTFFSLQINNSKCITHLHSLFTQSRYRFVWLMYKNRDRFERKLF